jgi:vacuolar-type H+-ATPase subunit I/STV1
MQVYDDMLVTDGRDQSGGIMEDSRRAIAEALDATETTDQEASLRVLGHALRWATAALRRLDDGASGAPALAALYALDDALTDGRALPQALPALLAAARPGKQVARGTEELMRELTETVDRVHSERESLERLADTEDALRRRLAEHEELRRQVDELRRLERLVVALDGLQEQQQVIGARLAELRGRDAGVDVGLRTSSDALVRLTEDQLAALAPQTRQTLQRAATVQSALAAAEREYQDGSDELATYQDRLESVHAAQGARLGSLKRHAQADRTLARALHEAAGPDGPLGAPDGGLTLEQVEAAADAIERRLREADATLTAILREREEHDTEGRTIVPRTGA